MRHRLGVPSTTLAIGVVLAGGETIRSQGTSPTARAWTPPRTPGGQPDIQGFWNNIDSFFTPFSVQRSWARSPP
ncbi:MAG: hypothetical protein FJW27_17720 [Acidimicrobiia bacterium]|nr:hypothetical protein [Acidimicrobiia bacterium]